MTETKITLHIPTKQFINNLKPGDLTLDCFGKLAKVETVNYKDNRESDAARFVGINLQFGSNGSTITQSYIEGELIRTVAMSNHFTSHQINDIEMQMKAQNVNFAYVTIDEIWDRFLPF